MKKPVKTRKSSTKTPKKQKKQGFSDAMKAFLLVGVIVAFSALISFAIILIHSSLNKEKTVNENDQQNEIYQSVFDDVENDTVTLKEFILNIENDAVQNEIQFPEQNAAQLNAQKPVNNRDPVPVSSSTAVSAIIPKQPEKPVQNLGTLVFVIDDAGNNLRELEPFLNIPGPLTIAVLPGLPHSAEAARRIRAACKEVILHQPMEAIGGQNPGPGAIYSNMSEAEIKEILARNIAEIGPVNGINNHQGSKITMEKQTMQVILSFCKENNLYFLDSRTTSDSVASEVARQIGIKFTERNVFIDNEQNKDAMLRYIGNGLTRSQRNGSAVMIGHTWSPELAPLLKEHFPLLTEQGYTIKTASDIVK